MKMMQNTGPNSESLPDNFAAGCISVAFGEVGLGYSVLQQLKLQITKALLCYSLFPCSHLSLDK